MPFEALAYAFKFFMDYTICMSKQPIIKYGKVNWKAFLELQNKHEIGKPSQVEYQEAVDELIQAGVFSTVELGNYVFSAGGGSLLRSPTEPIYFTRRQDAEEYSALRWPQLEKERNVHRIS